MPITLTLDDDDLLTALRARSEREGRPMEAVATDFLRRGLAERPAPAAAPRYPPGDIRNDWQLLPLRPEEPPVTNELVRRLRDETE